MVQRGDYINPADKKKTAYYPQVVRNETLNLDDIAMRMAKGKSMQSFEIKSTVQLLLACIEDELLDGNSICLDGFGTFAVSAQAKRHVTEPNEIRAESIEIKRVTFTPSAPLRNRLKCAKFVKSVMK